MDCKKCLEGRCRNLAASHLLVVIFAFFILWIIRFVHCIRVLAVDNLLLRPVVFPACFPCFNSRDVCIREKRVASSRNLELDEHCTSTHMKCQAQWIHTGKGQKSRGQKREAENEKVGRKLGAQRSESVLTEPIEVTRTSLAIGVLGSFGGGLCIRNHFAQLPGGPASGFLPFVSVVYRLIFQAQPLCVHVCT